MIVRGICIKLVRERWLNGLVMGVAILFMFGGQLQVFRDPPDKYGFVFLILGFVLFFAASRTAIPDVRLNAIQPVTPFRIKIRWLVVSMVLSTFIAWRGTWEPPQANLIEYALVWGLSIGVLLYSVKSPAVAIPERKPQHWEYGLLIALFIGALVIRGVNLGLMPSLMDDNEGRFALTGMIIRDSGFTINPFRPGFDSYPFVFQTMIGLTTGIWGQTLAAARLPSVIMGALGIPAVYLFGRELFGWRHGLVAALFMLSWPLHVFFSRLALNQTGDSLFSTLCVYFLLRGLRRGAVTDYLLCGVMLGIAQFFYLGGRLIPFIMIAYLGYFWLRQREFIIQRSRHLLLIPLAAFVTTLPQHYYLFDHRLPITAHTQPSIFVGGQLWEVMGNGENVLEYLGNQIKDSFLALFSTSDQSAWYGSGSNLLGPLGGPLFLIGVGVSALICFSKLQHRSTSNSITERQSFWVLAPGWALAVILMGGTFTSFPPQYQRYFPAVSAFALLIAIGISTISANVSTKIHRPTLDKKLTIGFGMVLFAANLAFFVTVFVPEAKYFPKRFTWVTNQVAQVMVTAYDAGQQVILISDKNGVGNTPVVGYFMAHRKYITIDEDVSKARAAINANKPMTFLVAPSRKDTLSIIRDWFPDGQLSESFLDRDGSLLATGH